MADGDVTEKTSIASEAQRRRRRREFLEAREQDRELLDRVFPRAAARRRGRRRLATYRY
jgi:hypothetical protein